MLPRLLRFSVALLLLASCQDLERRLFKPRMKVTCHILEGHCVFENRGDPGRSCVVVELKQVESAKTLRSRPVCSGLTSTNERRVSRVDWPQDKNPFVFCMGEDLAGNFYKNCSVHLDRQDPVQGRQ